MLDPISLLEKAVGIASVSGQEAECARYLVSQLQTFADEAFVDGAGNAVARLGRGERQVVFLGHIDTVPGEVQVRIENGELWGRGSVDAKGAFCTAVAAASQLDAEVLERLTLTLIGAVEEEAPSSRGARYALTAYPEPHFVIIGEPSGWDAITLGYKGRLVVKLSLEKDNFHSAGNDVTAAEAITESWQLIRNWAELVNGGTEEVFARVQTSLQSVCSHSDGLRQQAEAVVGLRLPLTMTPEAAEVALHWVLGLSEEAQLNVDFSGHERAYRSEKDSPLSRAFRTAIRRHGGRPRFKLKTGTADMNVIALHWKVPILAYGPGDSALDHRPDERLKLSDYERTIRVLRDTLTGIAGCTLNPGCSNDLELE